MESYEQLLDRAYEKVKVVEGSGERFEIPKVEGFFEGKKTIITNKNENMSIIPFSTLFRCVLLSLTAMANEKMGNISRAGFSLPSKY